VLLPRIAAGQDLARVAKPTKVLGHSLSLYESLRPCDILASKKLRILAMLDPVPASPSPLCRRLRALACLCVLGLCASPASALPPLESGPAPGPLLAQGEPPGSEHRAQEDPQRPFDALELSRA
jgi:hypothetical protein